MICFVCMSCSFISCCKWRVNQPITSPLHLILILCLEYIHWSFPIKPPIDITPKSISEILFCPFISPLWHKRQVPLSFYFSSLIEGLHLLTKYPWPKQFGLCVCHVLSFRIVKVPYETNNDRFKYNEYIDSYSKKKYIDSYNRKEKNDWCAHCKAKKVKKVHRFLQYGKKKMINVHAVNKKKKVKKVNRFLQYGRKKWFMCTL